MALVVVVSASTLFGGALVAHQDPADPSFDGWTFEETARLGVIDGARTQVLGEVSGIAADLRSGIMFVLDGLDARLSAFTFDGGFMASAGGRGEGPGELVRPVTVVAEESVAHVVDFGANRVTRFRLASDSLQYVGQTRLPVPGPTNVCRLDGSYYVMRYIESRRGHLIHRIADAGNVIASFGLPFVDGDPVMAAATDDGRLACDAKYRRVYVLSRAMPRVRAYSAEGSLLWEVQLPDVQIARIRRVEHGVSWSAPPGRDTNDRPVTLSALPGGYLVVQVQQGLWGQPTESNATTRSFLIDGRNGRIADESNDIPRIDLLSGNFAFSKRLELIPQVVVFRWLRDGDS